MGIQGCEHNKDAFGSEEGHPPVSFKHSCPQERQFLSQLFIQDQQVTLKSAYSSGCAVGLQGTVQAANTPM